MVDAAGSTGFGGQVGARVEAEVGLMRAAVRPLDDLAREITAGAVRSATAAWLGLVAEFDERGGWGGVGITSTCHPRNAASARVLEKPG